MIDPLSVSKNRPHRGFDEVLIATQVEPPPAESDSMGGWQQKLEDSNHASPTTRSMRQVPVDDSELRGPWCFFFRWYLITS